LEFRRVLFRSHVPTHVHIGVNGANGRMALEEMAQLAPLRARADDKDRRCCLFVERGYERTDVSAEADVDRACWGDASDERRRRGGGLSSRLKIAGSREQGVPSANENWPSVRDRKRSLAASAKELCPDRPQTWGATIRAAQAPRQPVQRRLEFLARGRRQVLATAGWRCCSSQASNMRTHQRRSCRLSFPERCLAQAVPIWSASKNPSARSLPGASRSSAHALRGPRSHGPMGTAKPVLGRSTNVKGTRLLSTSRSSHFLRPCLTFMEKGTLQQNWITEGSRNGTRVSRLTPILARSTFTRMSSDR